MKEEIVCWFCKKRQKSVFKKKIIKEYKGIKINVEIMIMHCSLCDHEIPRKTIEKENERILEIAYRKAIGMLQPEDIMKFLKEYKLLHTDLSKISCISTYIMNLYLKGRALSKEHNKILKEIIENKDVFIENLNSALRFKRISNQEYNRLMFIIDESFKSRRF